MGRYQTVVLIFSAVLAGCDDAFGPPDPAGSKGRDWSFYLNVGSSSMTCTAEGTLHLAFGDELTGYAHTTTACVSVRLNDVDNRTLSGGSYSPVQTSFYLELYRDQVFTGENLECRLTTSDDARVASSLRGNAKCDYQASSGGSVTTLYGLWGTSRSGIL